MMAPSRRRTQPARDGRGDGPSAFSEQELRALEERHPEGVSVHEVVDAFVKNGARLTEATFRKYVQLGLVPRSIRVGRKGKHRGSQGLYPSTTVRQIDHIRRLMGQGITMDEIQREFLFVRGDVDALERQLDRVYGALDRAIDTRYPKGSPSQERDALREARTVGADLVTRLEAIEHRLTLRARMARALV